MLHLPVIVWQLYKCLLRYNGLNHKTQKIVRSKIGRITAQIPKVTIQPYIHSHHYGSNQKNVNQAVLSAISLRSEFKK